MRRSAAAPTQIRYLNRGAYGFVILAHDNATEEEVALKFIKRGPQVRPAGGGGGGQAARVLVVVVLLLLLLLLCVAACCCCCCCLLLLLLLLLLLRVAAWRGLPQITLTAPWPWPWRAPPCCSTSPSMWTER